MAKGRKEKDENDAMLAMCIRHGTK